MPARGISGGNPSPPSNRVARAGVLLVVGLVLIALAFEAGRFVGHREGVVYARKQAQMVAYAIDTLEQAARSTRVCGDFAAYLKAVPHAKKTRRQMNLAAKRALAKPCRNCGGE